MPPLQYLLLILLLLFFFGNSQYLSGQVLPCGTPDIPLSNLQDLKSELSDSKPVPRKIAIWVYLLRDGTGQSANTLGDY